MAIFGTLDEFALSEMLVMLEKRSGCLQIWGLPKGHRCNIFINKGVIINLQYNNHPVDDVFELRDQVTKLMKIRQGDFEFNRLAEDKIEGEFSVPLRRLLINAANTIDEMETYRNKFPHPQTKFHRVQPLDEWGDQELFWFWERSYEQLARGISAKELAKELGLELERIQLYFYKLSVLDNIRPINAFESSRNKEKSRNALSLDDVLLEESDLIQTETEIQNNSPFSNTSKEHKKIQNSQKQENVSRGNIVQRMLKALSGGRRS